MWDLDNPTALSAAPFDIGSPSAESSGMASPPPPHYQSHKGRNGWFIVVSDPYPAIAQPYQVISNQLDVLVQSRKIATLGWKKIGVGPTELALFQGKVWPGPDSC